MRSCHAIQAPLVYCEQCCSAVLREVLCTAQTALQLRARACSASEPQYVLLLKYGNSTSDTAVLRALLSTLSINSVAQACMRAHQTVAELSQLHTLLPSNVQRISCLHHKWLRPLLLTMSFLLDLADWQVCLLLMSMIEYYQ
jgi:hypothetical protein